MGQNKTHQLILFFTCLVCSLFLSGCVTIYDPETSYDYTGDIVATVNKTTSVGQTFVSRRRGFNSIQLWLRLSSSDAKDTEKLTAKLFHSPEDMFALATTTIDYAKIKKSFPVTISFSPQVDPPYQIYYIKLETIDSPIAVYGRDEEGYPDGSLFTNEQNQPADMAFRASYDYNYQAILSDFGTAIKSSWLIFPLLLLLWAPGMLLLEGIDAAFKHDGGFLSRWDWGERLALAVGFSLAINPLIILWTSTLGLHWNRWYFMLAAGFMAIGLIALWIRRNKKGFCLPPLDLIDLALIVIFLFTLSIRMIMIRDLSVPAWVDPVHHVTISRIIFETGAYQRTYMPYAEASFSSYHPGFHGLTASLGWLSGLDLDQAMLILGQVLNALMVPAIYLLAKQMTRSRIAGLLAAYITSFLILMPAYYASWGRYTQLTGLLILPVCATLIMLLLHTLVFPLGVKASSPEKGVSGESASSEIDLNASKYQATILGVQYAGLAALSCAGLFMIHYRVIMFLAILIIAFFTGEVIRSLDKQPLWQSLPRSIILIIIIVLAAIFLSLPWWPDLVQSVILPRMAVNAPDPIPLQIDWGYLTPIYGKAVLWLAFAGLMIAIGRAAWFGPVLALWIALLFTASNQGIIRIPIGRSINLTSVEIMLFMPISILAGYGISEVIRLLKRISDRLLQGKGEKIAIGALGALMLAGALFGSRKLIPIINPSTLLFREADRPAMAWIEQQLPTNARFLINPFLWGYGFYAGADGGYWITPLTGRGSIPPTLLYGSGPRSAIERVNRIARETIEMAKDPPRLAAMMKAENIQYIYIGRRGGALSPKLLEESGLFKVIFKGEGTWVFEINR